ncbi:MAG: MaoC family dehydratase N-terminal domain-containing protein, partial [Pseudolabrys sp.]|nr:MaoC family dehydratase N-terminal domain-containing protein [Pseudolabrys sp.]
MAIVYDKLLALKIPPVAHDYTEKDAMLYALGLGLGMDPMNEDELAFVYEKSLKVLPTFCVVLGYSPYWLRTPESGVNWAKVVHGETGFTLHQPIPLKGSVIGRTKITEVIDKGEGKGALVFSERKVTDRASSALIATLSQTTFCRGDGGFGGPPRQAQVPHPLPQRPPDLVCDLPTRPEAALLYRLSGDPNPMHVDPAVAQRAGFSRPILHGLASFGVAAHA